MAAYEAYFSGKIEDYEHPEHEIEKSLKDLPKITFGQN
jgi:tryptophan synthase beta chain